MPKPGYTTLIVKEDLRVRLEAIARAEGFRTVNQFLESLLRVNPTTGGVYPRVNPNAPMNTFQYPETPIETEPILNPVLETEQEGREPRNRRFRWGRPDSDRGQESPSLLA